MLYVGGKFNPHLKFNGNKEIGWIFPLSYKLKVCDYVGTVNKGETVEVEKTEIKQDIRLVKYSEKSIAVLGNSRNFKDNLKVLGGRYNTSLNYEGNVQSGWIFNIDKEEQIKVLYNYSS